MYCPLGREMYCPPGREMYCPPGREMYCRTGVRWDTGRGTHGCCGLTA